MDEITRAIVDVLVELYLPTIISTVVAGFLFLVKEGVAWIRAKAGRDRQRLIDDIIRNAVAAVEQISKDPRVKLESDEKLRLAQEFVDGRFADLGIRLRASNIAAMIEGAVAENKWLIEDITKPKGESSVSVAVGEDE